MSIICTIRGGEFILILISDSDRKPDQEGIIAIGHQFNSRPCKAVFISRTSMGGGGGETTPARFKTKRRRA